MRDGTTKILIKALNQLADTFHSEQMPYVDFIRHAWPIIEPATPLAEGYYIDYVAELISPHVTVKVIWSQ
jgi:hypothetical protein